MSAIRINARGEKVYDSWKDGSDVYKNTKGFYIIQYNPKKNIEYNKYLPKSYKPTSQNEFKKSNKKKSNKKKSKKKKNNKKKSTKSFWNFFKF